MQRYIMEYAYVHRDFEAVCRLLANESDAVLSGAVEAAEHGANDIVADLEVEVAGVEIGKTVVVETGDFERHDDVARLPLRWHAQSVHALFPTMEADLEVYPLSGGSRPLTQLALVGHYRPPLWLLGAAGDTLLGHRVAVAAVSKFVDEIGHRIESLLPATPVTAGAAADRAS